MKEIRRKDPMRKSLAAVLITVALALVSTVNVFAVEADVQLTAPAAAGVININTADVAQLSLLPRIGEKAAQRIVDYRKEHGAFKKTTDLMQVKGVGEKSFELLRPYLAVDGKTTLASKQHAPRKPRAKKNQPSNQAQ
jgi:competence protein ComEA